MASIATVTAKLSNPGAKCQSSLPLKYGIDRLDGGSPLLFTVESGIKSSRQVIQGLRSLYTLVSEGLSDLEHLQRKLILQYAHKYRLGLEQSLVKRKRQQKIGKGKWPHIVHQWEKRVPKFSTSKYHHHCLDGQHSPHSWG
ncbi:hypothetical protein CJ030_MR1G003957 [Morella rubra]|uniref:Uncharacterized protein n=1 Tax=Morella rubra TaxID=262757 RepID=A0A6A1WSZ2_9ROSI|nr:hypothetical protein CJ030_MR1G003957 [Morella rubra]